MDYNQRWKEQIRFSRQRVVDVICAEGEEKQRLREDPVTLLAAEYQYSHQPSHQCYWNNRACIALACDMSLWQKQLAMWCAVSNGLHDYWEWITHDNYDMYRVLQAEGVEIPCNERRDSGAAYCSISQKFASILIARYELPTLQFGVHGSLNDEQRRAAKLFEEEYPFHPIL